MELIHPPGECLQVDWGKLFDVIDQSGKKKAIWIFIGVLDWVILMRVIRPGRKVLHES